MSSSLTRGLSILDFLVAKQRPMRLTEICQGLSLSKSGVHGLLATLVECGYVEHLPGGIYQLGHKAWEVGGAFPTAELLRVAGPVMESLVEEVQEGAILGVLNGYEVSYLHLVECNQVVRVHAKVGDQIQAHCTATGLALLAFQDTSYIDGIAAEELSGKTPHTITDLGMLRAELKRIRMRGYSINRGGWNADVGGISAPILGAHSRVTAAICVSAPLYRINQQWISRIAPVLLGKAAEIGRGLAAPSPVSRANSL